MTDLAAVSKEIDKVLDAVKASQSKITELDGKVGAFDKAVLEKAAKDATDGLMAIQEHKQKAAAKEAEMESEILLMKKQIARGGASVSKGEEVSEVERDYIKQFNRFARSGAAITGNALDDISRQMAEKTFVNVDDDRLAGLTKDLAAGSNPSGGFFLRPQRASFMATRIFETSPLRRFANVVSVAGDNLEIIIDDNEATSGGWVGEVSTRAKSATPDIGKITINVHEQFAMPIATQKMLDDGGFDVEGWLSGKVVDKMSRTENTAFVRGTGALSPKGFLSYTAASAADTYQRGTIGQFTGTGASALIDSASDLKSVQALMKEAYQGGAVWGMKRATFGSVVNLKDTYGQFVFQSRFINEMDNQTLLGKEVVFMDDMDAIAASALAIVYANFKLGYTIVDRFGFRVIRDDVTNKPYVQFYTTKRVGGDVTNYDCIKLLKVKP